MNALRHGYRSRAWQLKARRIRRAIRLCADTVLLVRVLRLRQQRAALPSPHNAPEARRQWPKPPPSCIREADNAPRHPSIP
jgi:hypothetical protein